MRRSGLLSKGGGPKFLPLRAKPMWAGPSWAPLGPCRPAWDLAGRALVGRALAGPPGPLWARLALLRAVPWRAGPLQAGPL